jgi:hypothetical protein
VDSNESNHEWSKEMTEWIKTKDRLPAKPGIRSYEHVDCWIVVKGEVMERPWNCEHQVWDDVHYDDWEFNAHEPSHWMQKLPPLPPINNESNHEG